MKKISLIVPVYNVEKYLEKCIESLINQIYSNIEIILIDDGSTDNSPQICDKYAIKDERIVVFHTKNHGVSSARNTGLINATGEFIAFVDSDDYVMPNYIDCMVKCLESNNAELAVCSYKLKFENRNVPIKSKNKKSTYMVKKKKDFFSLYQHSLTPSACGKLFVKSKITDKFNISLDYGEDDLFVLQYLKNINTVVFSSEMPYMYRIDNRETLTKKAYKNLLNKFEKLHKLRVDAIKQVCDSKLAYSALAMSNIRQTTIMLEANIKSKKSYKEYKILFENIRNDNYFKSLLKIAKHRSFKELVILMVYKLNMPFVLYKYLKEK